MQKLRVLRQDLRKCGTKGKTEFIVYTGTVHTCKVNQMPIYWGKIPPPPPGGRLEILVDEILGGKLYEKASVKRWENSEEREKIKQNGC